MHNARMSEANVTEKDLPRPTGPGTVSYTHLTLPTIYSV